MLPIPYYSHRSKIIHLFIISAITILSSATFHGWILNQRHKSRYYNSHNPFSPGPTYLHPPTHHPQWPFIASRRNYKEHPITHAPLDFANIKKANYHRHHNTHHENKNDKPSSAICRKSGYFHYPNNCKKFYRCVATHRIVSEIFGGSSRFTIFHFDCPAGTIFDERVQVCNHPRVAKCTEQNVGDDGVDIGISTDVSNPDIEHDSESNGFGSVIPEDEDIDSGHISSSTPPGINEIPTETDEHEINHEHIPGDILDLENGNGDDNAHINESLDVVGSEDDSHIHISQTTHPSSVGVIGGYPENEAGIGYPVESEETSATVIMDGFVIEKPAPGTGLDSEDISSGSNDILINPIVSSGQGTSPLPPSISTGQQLGTDDSLPQGEVQDPDTVFTSPSNVPTVSSSTVVAIVSDNVGDNITGGLGQITTVFEDNIGDVDAQNPFIETVDNSLGILAGSVNGSINLIVGGGDAGQETPAFITSTESTLTTVSNSDESGTFNDNDINDGITGSNIESNAPNQDAENENIDHVYPNNEISDNNLIVESTPSSGGVNIIEGINQIISSQIEVSDENKSEDELSQSSVPVSIPINIVDGFDVGSSSAEGGIVDESVSDQEGLRPLNNESAIDLITHGDNHNNMGSIVSDEDIKYQVLSGSLYDCLEPGFYPYELNCVEFYVCLEVLPNILFAEQLYRCPKRYLFDEVSRRCQKEDTVTCNRPQNTGEGVSTKSKENVLVVVEQFLEKFFNHSLTYNS